MHRLHTHITKPHKTPNFTRTSIWLNDCSVATYWSSVRGKVTTKLVPFAKGTAGSAP